LRHVENSFRRANRSEKKGAETAPLSPSIGPCRPAPSAVAGAGGIVAARGPAAAAGRAIAATLLAAHVPLLALLALALLTLLALLPRLALLSLLALLPRLALLPLLALLAFLPPGLSLLALPIRLALLALLPLLILVLIRLVLGIAIRHGLGSVCWNAADGRRAAAYSQQSCRGGAQGACGTRERELVEWKGIEPSTFALRTRRSPS
jgi:hypothetical protein